MSPVSIVFDSHLNSRVNYIDHDVSKYKLIYIYVCIGFEGSEKRYYRTLDLKS